jgi:TonB family protein
VHEPIDLVVTEERQRAGGISLAVAVSFVLHASLIAWFIASYEPAPSARPSGPMVRYVELMKQQPSQFTEAPGKKVDAAPLNAPLSDANRKAATPNPTGESPTLRPSDREGMYQATPNPAPRGPKPSQSAAQIAAMPQPQSQNASPSGQAVSDRLVYREPAQASAMAAATIDWNSAIREVGKIASLGGGDGIDLGNLGAGEKGTAEQGPLSFETQWYDWGDYAQSMVSRIRVNWYANMPQIIRTGMKGVVTIRFTIQRDGRITDITILNSSTVPPYDFAARKAIELSSPLNPLPKDFPNPNERVTAMFYYNRDIPR